MSEEHRRVLGIPVHTDADHTYVDGYCTCGAAEKRRGDGPRPRGHGDGYGGRAMGRVDIDRIEGNPSGDRS